MLAAIIFSWFWIVICTSSNCMTTSVYILALVYPDIPYSDLPHGWVRFVAVVVQTVACLLLYFARRLCFMFNSVFALFKIILLLVLFAAGMAACHEPGSGLKDWGSTPPGAGGMNTLSAMIYVIFSYQGWEHTNYVGFAITEKYIELTNNLEIAGEIREPKWVLKVGVFLSIGIVTVLYMLVTAAYVSQRETRYRATGLTLGTSILLCLTRLLMMGRLSLMKGSHLLSAKRFGFLRGEASFANH